MRNKPRIRFKGFTEDWEQRKLGEIFEYLQNNTLSRDSLNYKNPNIKNIHYGDILVKFDEILDGSNKDIPYINPELDLSKFSKSLLRDGDIIFSDTAEDDTVGKAIELQNVNAPFILSGLHTIPCRPLIPFGKGYLGNFLNSNSYRLQLRPLVQGIKVSSISKSALKDTMIEYPKNLDEQEKIGSLFYYIAKMITLHQRKLENLKLAKKALLQKLFPKNGSQFPEIRFKGFTDAWEQRKLGDTNTFFTDGNYGNDYPTANEMSDSINGVPFLRGSNLDNGAINLMDVHYITKQKHNLLTSGHTKFDDIIIAVRGSLGNCGYVAKQFIDININSQLAIIRTNKNELSGLFLIEYLLSYLGKKEINRNITGTALKQLPINSLKMINIKYPAINEQEKISILLSKLNTSITLHQCKLDKLQDVKKGLLQKMFV